MKRYRPAVVRKPRRWLPCEPGYFLEGFEGEALVTSGYVFRCPACRDVEIAGCSTCSGAGGLALDDQRIRRAAVAA